MISCAHTELHLVDYRLYILLHITVLLLDCVSYSLRNRLYTDTHELSKVVSYHDLHTLLNLVHRLYFGIHYI